jgi:hypothetical protein
MHSVPSSVDGAVRRPTAATEPAATEPAAAEPVGAAPVGAAPVGAAPVGAAPAGADPATTVPVAPERRCTGTVYAFRCGRSAGHDGVHQLGAVIW